MMNRKLPQPGQRYRHFKDRLYQIITLATDSETGEQMVVYQALYDDFTVYVRPLSLFMSETDLEKYPEAKQRYRFEEVSAGNIPDRSEEAAITDPGTSLSESPAESLPEGISPKLMEFLDADTDEARYKILSEMENIVDDHMIDTMAVVSDIVIDDGPIEKRFQELKNCIRTRMRYETNRLR